VARRRLLWFMPKLRAPTDRVRIKLPLLDVCKSKTKTEDLRRSR
jgi:hypothetical protein